MLGLDLGLALGLRLALVLGFEPSSPTFVRARSQSYAVFLPVGTI